MEKVKGEQPSSCGHKRATTKSVAQKFDRLQLGDGDAYEQASASFSPFTTEFAAQQSRLAKICAGWSLAAADKQSFGARRGRLPKQWRFSTDFRSPFLV